MKPVLILLLAFGLRAGIADAAEELVTTAQFASGEPIPCVLDSVSPNPKYVVILFPGGTGAMNPRMRDGRLVYDFAGNFLIRARKFFVDEDFATVATNSSDSEERIQGVLEDIKRRYPNAKIYLAGPSTGTFYTMNLPGYRQDRSAAQLPPSCPAQRPPGLSVGPPGAADRGCADVRPGRGGLGHLRRVVARGCRRRLCRERCPALDRRLCGAAAGGWGRLRSRWHDRQPVGPGNRAYDRADTAYRVRFCWPAALQSGGPDRRALLDPVRVRREGCRARRRPKRGAPTAQWRKSAHGPGRAGARDIHRSLRAHGHTALRRCSRADPWALGV